MVQFPGHSAHRGASLLVAPVFAPGQHLSRALSRLAAAPMLQWVYQHRLFEPALSGSAAAGLLLGLEFFYYCCRHAGRP